MSTPKPPGPLSPEQARQFREAQTEPVLAELRAIRQVLEELLAVAKDQRLG